MASEASAGSRRSRMLGEGPARGVAVAVLSSIVVFTVLVVTIVNAPGWPTVHQRMFNGHEFRVWFPDILSAFWLNIKIFSVSEVAILAFALGIAVLRSLPGPVFFPLRAIAIAYTDLFRGVPTILVV